MIRLGFAVLGLVSTQVVADWQLNNAESQLYFVSTKNEHISEVHHFEQLTGTLSDDGRLQVSIDLASVNTGIEIRDKRMREKLFHIDVMPDIDVTAQLPADVMAMAEGDSKIVTTNATLALQDTRVDVPMTLHVARLKDNAFTATNSAPIILNAASLGLSDGLEVLKSIAGLSSISQTVPVTLHVTFRQD